MFIGEMMELISKFLTARSCVNTLPSASDLFGFVVLQEILAYRLIHIRTTFRWIAVNKES